MTQIMKIRILNIITTAAIIVFAASCSSDNDYSDRLNSVMVTAAKTEMPVEGGTGTISVTGDGISATSDDDWLAVSVNGNVINMTALSNDNKQSRHTIVSIKAANGDCAVVNVSQAGLVMCSEVKDTYLFEAVENTSAEFFDITNVPYETSISDSWLHFEKSEKGYTIRVDNNEGAYRNGTIVLKYKNLYSKTIHIGQWGESLPFTSLTTATYEDEEGNTYQKAVTVVADETDETGNTYLINGLMAEGPLSLKLNTKTTDKVEYYVASGYSPGKLTEDGTTYTLRCLMSCYNVNTGNRYYPTQVTTLESSAYRMAFEWQVDENAMPSFNYVRNNSLSQTYRTDGIIVCKFSSTSGASAAARKGIAYQFLNLKLTY